MKPACSRAAFSSARLAAALQRHDQRRSAGRAQPDEHHVQGAVREAVAGVIDAHRRVAQVSRRSGTGRWSPAPAPGSATAPPARRRSRRRCALARTNAPPAPRFSSVGSTKISTTAAAAPMPATGAAPRRPPSRSGPRRAQKPPSVMGDVHQRRASHVAGRAAALLVELGEAARQDRRQARGHGDLHRSAARPAPAARRPPRPRRRRPRRSSSGRGWRNDRPGRPPSASGA